MKVAMRFKSSVFQIDAQQSSVLQIKEKGMKKCVAISYISMKLQEFLPMAVRVHNCQHFAKNQFVGDKTEAYWTITEKLLMIPLL